MLANPVRRFFERLIPRRKAEIDKNVVEGVSAPKYIPEDDGIIKSIYSNSITLFQGTDINSMEEEKKIALYRQMENDAVISAALDLYADNATQVNPKTGHAISVECKDAEVARELNDFLWNRVKIDTEAWQIVRDIARDGKIFLDTKVDKTDWSFIPVENPAKVNALFLGQGNIKYFVVAPEENKDDKSSSLFKPIYGSDKLNMDEYTVEDKDRFIAGFNTREIIGKMTVELESKFKDEPIQEELMIKSGRSILAGVVTTYQTLSALEDALFINRLTKSTEFKIVQVDVSDSNNKQAKQIIDAVKNAFKSSETINQTNDRYQSRQSPIPINDFIYIPKKGEKGGITIESVGGDVGEQKLDDINYYRNKLFAGLGVLKAYLGFEETTPGGLGDATLSKLDERFGRRVVRLQQVLKDVVEQMISYYWRYSSLDRNLKNMPQYKIILGKISTKEEEENRNRLDRSMDIANKFIGIVKDPMFVARVDEDKLFKFVFNDIIGINISMFDSEPDKEDISLKIHKIGESIKRDIPRIKERLMAKRFIRGNHLLLLNSNNSEFSDLFKEYGVFVQTNGKEIPLSEALRRRRYMRIFDEATYKQLKDASKMEDPARLKKSKKLVAKYTGLDSDNNITFRITAENPQANKAYGRPTSYNVKVSLKDLAEKIVDLANSDERPSDKDLIMTALKDGDIGVSCNCPAAMYWGQQYNGTVDDYSLDKNTIPPKRNIPTQPICKHTLAALTVLPFWWNTIIRDLRNAGVLPSSKDLDKKKDDVTVSLKAKNIEDIEDIDNEEKISR